MILRLWHGVTPSAKAKAFHDYVKQTGEPAYLRARGNRGVMIISRPDETRTDGAYTEFILLSLWDSIEDLKGFAGSDYEKAQYPFPRDREFLIELEEKVKHFDVLSWTR
ncbi:MAG: antibiotic biosynthesis monooxygenase [candidate division Zixibacteria bacterium]|nr:antibiotic biosynthesis monooxygenase [candidate division Zixibacteria bacterium]